MYTLGLKWLVGQFFLTDNHLLYIEQFFIKSHLKFSPSLNINFVHCSGESWQYFWQLHPWNISITKLHIYKIYKFTKFWLIPSSVWSMLAIQWAPDINRELFYVIFRMSFENNIMLIRKFAFKINNFDNYLCVRIWIRVRIARTLCSLNVIGIIQI